MVFKLVNPQLSKASPLLRHSQSQTCVVFNINCEERGMLKRPCSFELPREGYPVHSLKAKMDDRRQEAGRHRRREHVLCRLVHLGLNPGTWSHLLRCLGLHFHIRKMGTIRYSSKNCENLMCNVRRHFHLVWNFWSLSKTRKLICF